LIDLIGQPQKDKSVEHNYALLRLILMVVGLLFAMPANEFVGLDHLGLSAIGLSMAIPFFVISRWYGKH
jgi:hypothetical protein